jgi:sugar/nucleoside kinase (ribokinase family)
MTQTTQPPRQPRIAAIGLASWDHFIEVDRYPVSGSYAIVRNTASLPGGTTSNSAVTLARLGTGVTLAALIGPSDALNPRTRGS